MAKPMFKIGDRVMVASDNDNENYDKFRGKTLVINHVATNEAQHRGYDSSMEGMALYSFKGVPFSLYEYEIEQKAKRGTTIKGGGMKKLTISDDGILEYANLAHQDGIDVTSENLELSSEDIAEVKKFLKESKGLVKFTGKFFDWKEEDEMERYISKYEDKWAYGYNAYPGGDGWLIVLSKVEIEGAEEIYSNPKAKRGTTINGGGVDAKKPKMVRSIFEEEEYEYKNGGTMEKKWKVYFKNVDTGEVESVVVEARTKSQAKNKAEFNFDEDWVLIDVEEVMKNGGNTNSFTYTIGGL